MNKALSFDDVLIIPRFSSVKSRKDVDLSSLGLKLPIISSNMDTVTGVDMAKAMSKAGGVACLHRFQSIEDNIKQFKETEVKPWVSIGLGVKELERTEALLAAGAGTFVIDVANGASLETTKQTKNLKSILNGNAEIVVGNFATANSIYHFNEISGLVSAYKVGIGGGSACTTRIKTGCGLPTLYSVMDCSRLSGINVIADGGMRTPGDISKALAAGAVAVMIGNLLAGTDETPGEVITETEYSDRWSYTNSGWVTHDIVKLYKKYRGSASKESYLDQGKEAPHRAVEGESFLVPCKGPVSNVLQDIEGGLRSALSYVGATNIKQFKELAEFVEITSNGTKENGAHGANK